MLDLYLILVPLFSITTIINLIYLKFSIRDTQAIFQIATQKLAD